MKKLIVIMLLTVFSISLTSSVAMACGGDKMTEGTTAQESTAE